MKNKYAKLTLALLVLIVIGVALFFVLTEDNECVEHTDSNLDGVCDICGEITLFVCTDHSDENLDKKCDICDKELSSQAQICQSCQKPTEECICNTDEPPTEPEDAECTECVDTDEDGFCDSCEKPVVTEDVPCTECVDSDEDGFCDSCEKPIVTEDVPCTECVDSDEDGFCDSCEKPVTTENFPCTECVDSDEDGFCDSCEKPVITENFPCTECVDSDEDGFCDSCEKPVVTEEVPCTECIDSDEDGFCDSCEKPVITENIPCTECVDSDEDGFCDTCEKPVVIENVPCTECVDSDEDGFCDICQKPIVTEDVPCTECVDSDKNGQCDVCSESVEPEIEYEINSFLISGHAVTDYVIAYDDSATENATLAYKIQSFIYEKSGLLLEVIKADELGSENYIAVKSAIRSGKEGFYVKTDGENLEITSEFSNKTVSAGTAYLESLAKDDNANVELKEETQNVRDVFYEDFDAVGDGVTDDSAAIASTHEYANQHGHTVVAKQNATYYIGPMIDSIKIKTDTNFADASFIIDDREIDGTSPESKVAIFEIISDHEEHIFDADSEIVRQLLSSGNLISGASEIGISLGYKAILVIENEGALKKEMLLISEDGKIDGSTPLTTSFDSISKLYVKRADDAPITITGGTFIRLVNQSQSESRYERNIRISRSNVTLSSDTSYEIVDDNTDTPYSLYSPFINVYNSNNLLISGVRLKSHPILKSENGENTESCTVSVSHSINVKLIGCTESNALAIDGITPIDETSDFLYCIYTRNISLERCRFNSAYIADGVDGLELSKTRINKINYKHPIITED